VAKSREMVVVQDSQMHMADVFQKYQLFLKQNKTKQKTNPENKPALSKGLLFQTHIQIPVFLLEKHSPGKL